VAGERRQPGTHPLGVGQPFEELKRQLAQQRFSLCEQMLAAFEQRTPRAEPDRQQLALLVGASILTGALERSGQQRVRQCLARDPLGVERVRLAALARPVLASGAIRAHIAHVIAAADQEDRRVPTPRRGALDPDPRDRAELPRPRLQRPVTIARDAEVLAGHDPSARIDDRCRQGALVRVDPTTLPAQSGANSVLDGPGPGRTRLR
jgi:hypothetical protein